VSKICTGFPGSLSHYRRVYSAPWEECLTCTMAIYAEASPKQPQNALPEGNMICVRNLALRHKDTQTHRHTDTQTHRHTDTHGMSWGTVWWAAVGSTGRGGKTANP
jgi:hypothetical protein